MVAKGCNERTGPAECDNLPGWKVSRATVDIETEQPEAKYCEEHISAAMARWLRIFSPEWLKVEKVTYD